MDRSLSRRQFVAASLGTFAGVSASGCGTILYPERKGQPAGSLDWGIVALDAIGLLLFFVPGVIAFAVDFNNGTIYLPSGSYGQTPPDKHRILRPIVVPRSQLTPAAIEQLIARETQQVVTLSDDNYITQPLVHIDDFWSTADSLAGHATATDHGTPS